MRAMVPVPTTWGQGVTWRAICQAAGTLRITNCVFHYNWAMDASLPRAVLADKSR